MYERVPSGATAIHSQSRRRNSSTNATTKPVRSRRLIGNPPIRFSSPAKGQKNIESLPIQCARNPWPIRNSTPITKSQLDVCG